MRTMVALCAAAVLFVVAAPVSAAPSTVVVVDAKVMTQNLYIGADLARLLPSDDEPPEPGEPPAAVFETALASDIPGRLATFAAQVDEQNPDLIGLQEVTKIVVFDSLGNTILDLDYLEIVLGNLAARGESYAVSSVVENADVTLPIAPGRFARVVDRDVIIHNTATTDVLNAESANFATNFAFELGGFPIEFTRGYTSVDAVVGGSSFRFVNTHLEVQNAPCLVDEVWVICQEVQAAELVEALDRELLPIVLLGDFNAEPGEPTYQTIVNGGYADTWNGDDEGYTCCQSELLNEPSDLTQRIDHIFHSTGNASLVSATTDTVTARTPPQEPVPGAPRGDLWYSDHAGVVADLSLFVTDLCAVLTPTVEGGPGNDLIFGTDGDDIIFTYGGDDTVFGMEGDDIICSGDGDDIISAGDGYDRVDTGFGDDLVYAGDGDDLVYAGDGDDVVDLGDGANTLIAGPGDDNITGGADTDNLDLGSGDDVAQSGDGDDRIDGGLGIDTVDAGAGTDTCISAEFSVGCEL